MKNSASLARVDIPLYLVNVINERHILVAGGGGQANTGVKNLVEIYEILRPTEENSSLAICSARLVKRLNTGSRAIMSGTVFQSDKHYVLAGGGINGECLLWKMRLIVKSNRPEQHLVNGNAGGIRPNNNLNGDGNNLVHRHVGALAAGGANVGGDDRPVPGGVGAGRRSRSNSEVVPESELGYNFELTPVESFQTDFSSVDDEPFVKVIRYNKALSCLVAGGADGHIRIWRYPNVIKLVDILAHKDEIDDLDIHPLGTVIASVSRDGHGYIWDANSGKKQCELKVSLPPSSSAGKSTQPVKYLLRACRFGMVNDSNPTVYKLFTVHNPAIRHKPPYPAYICKWDVTNNYALEKVISLGPIMVSSMAISSDGRFIGIGTQEGTVEIYIAFSLQKLYSNPRAHNIFVTGLEFLKTCPQTQLLTNNNDTSLVSISVDRHIGIHCIPKQRSLGLYTLMFCFAIGLIFIYEILYLLGL